MTAPLRAVVTGASSGIGAATVRRLRADGWEVVAGARREDRLRDLASETGCEWHVLDVTDAASVAAFAAATLAGGPVNSLVNNAGGAFGLDPVETTAIDDWQRMYDVNVIGTLAVTQAFLPSLRETGRGDIVFITSTASLGTYPGGAGYTAAKHAERMIADTLRIELAGQPIRVIQIAPGAVQTDFSEVRFGGDKERAASIYKGYDPLVADDIADAVSWTLSREHHVNIDQMIIRPRAQTGMGSPAKP